MSGSDWYFEAVRYASLEGLFNGTTSTTFSPNAAMTRAMLFTVLARLDGQDTTGGETWYSVALAWAKSEGISDGTNPEGNITREQLATILYRYVGFPGATGSLSGYTDGGSVSEWARQAMAWAVGKGIITGKTSSTLDPTGNASRAEIATMLMRFAGTTN